jgi:acetolactate synthase I/II/III large subunit
MTYLTDLHNSKRPVIIAGAGCIPSFDALRRLATTYSIPVISTLPSIGIVPTDSHISFGYLGHTGHPYANAIIHESDFVIALGTRLDVRQTGTLVNEFVPKAKVLMVNNDFRESVIPRVRVDYAICDDCGKFLEQLEFALSPIDGATHMHPHTQWLARCEELVSLNPLPACDFARIISEIDEMYFGDVIFVTGVGSHQQWAARCLTLDYGRRMFVTSSGHGTMGAGLPMAIGAALETQRKVVLIDGDGSFQMSIPELGTMMANFPRIDLDIHIIDNKGGGIVSQFCELNGYSDAETTWDNPDFEAIGKAYGIKVRVWKTEEEGVYPILEGGRRMDDMTYEKR